MSDNLNIFGTTYSNVTGIKATDTNNVVQTFIKPTGTKSITANGTGRARSRGSNYYAYVGTLTIIQKS